MTVEWTQDMSVGVDKIDEQHRELVRRINTLYAAVEVQKGDEEIISTFYFLEDYIVRHFLDEQTQMFLYKFPDRDEHLSIHNAFMRDIIVLKIKYEEDGPTPELLDELQRRVSDWFKNHVMVKDKELGRFIIEKGALPPTLPQR